jgi:hypothetical protein
MAIRCRMAFRRRLPPRLRRWRTRPAEEASSGVQNHFRPRRHRLPAEHYRQLRSTSFQQWRDAAKLEAAA